MLQNFIINLPNCNEISFFTLIDFGIVGLIVFLFYRALKDTAAFNILIAIIISAILYTLAKRYNMPFLRLIFKTIISTGLVGIIVVFQPEIRKFLINFGKHSPIGKNGFITKFLNSSKEEDSENSEKNIEQIAKCLVYCVANKLGALIIVVHNKDLSYEVNSGIAIQGELSSKLLESIFEKQSPLHDGAVVVQNDVIVAARVVLPVSDNDNLPVRMGLRHRAAIGATEQHDLLAIIVSEEKGSLSFATEGKIYEHQSLDDIKDRLRLFYVS
jgi:diadenylate cyclase